MHHALAFLFLLPPAPVAELDGPVLKIWEKGGHNAFTDLIRFKNEWFCVFREGKGHASGEGKIRVLVSNDGQKWKSAALIGQKNIDLRDAHICITPDGRLMINGGAAFPSTRNPITDHYSFTSFSKDGRKWTEPQRIGESWQWLWRVLWHKDKAYTVAYQWDPKAKRRAYTGLLLQSKDGLKYSLLKEFDLPNRSEATLRVHDGEMFCLQRRDGSPNTALIGRSTAPFTKWTWKNLGMYFGGPDFIRLPNGEWWACGRLRKGGAKTVLCRLDVDKGVLQPVLTLPSGGDTSYPGMVWHNDRLWICYYSSHEKKTCIYLAKVRIGGTK